LKILFRLEVEGKKNIPKEGAFILASNHISFLDPVAVGVACPRKLNYMARHDLFSHPAFGWLLYRVNSFPVKRESADLSALKEAMKRLKEGQGLLLFPEGGRRFEDEVSRPQAGIGFLAAKLNCPVIPTYVKDTGKALPRGAKFIKPVKISVHFGKEILIERRMPYQDIAQLIMTNIRHLSC